MTTHAGTVAAFDARASLTRNILALTSGLTLWTAVHFGVTAILPLLLHDQGYDARGMPIRGMDRRCLRAPHTAGSLPRASRERFRAPLLPRGLGRAREPRPHRRRVQSGYHGIFHPRGRGRPARAPR